MSRSSSSARPTADETYLAMVKLIEKHSTCHSLKVGSLITKGGHPVTSGYNGVPSNFPHCSDLFGPGGELEGTNHHDWSKWRELHAEENAIVFAARQGISIDGGTLYSTVCPCLKCSSIIAAAGIVRVVFAKYYARDAKHEGEALMRQAGIEVVHVPE